MCCAVSYVSMSTATPSLPCAVRIHTPDLCSIGKLHLVRQALSRNANVNLANAAPRLGLAQNEPWSRIITSSCLHGTQRTCLLILRGLCGWRPRVARSAFCTGKGKYIRPLTASMDSSRCSFSSLFGKAPGPSGLSKCLLAPGEPRLRTAWLSPSTQVSGGEKWSTGCRYGAVDDGRTLSCSLPGTGPFFSLFFLFLTWDLEYEHSIADLCYLRCVGCCAWAVAQTEIDGVEGCCTQHTCMHQPVVLVFELRLPAQALSEALPPSSTAATAREWL
ncbi:hypothetical protein V8C34DRAFT_200105 [Trichoderma compactum]